CRLSEVHDRKTEHHSRSLIFGVGRSCRIQEDLSDFHGTWVSDPPAFSGLSQSYALERTDRRQCCDFPTLCLAETVQCQRYTSPQSHSESSRYQDCRRVGKKVPRFQARLR